MSQTEQMSQCKTKECTKQKLRPLGNRVLVRRIESNEKLKGGILLPDSAKKKQEQAEVVAIGTGKKDKQGNPIAIPVKIGDIVLMEKYSGQDITLNDEEFVILKADDIIAIIER